MYLYIYIYMLHKKGGFAMTHAIIVYIYIYSITVQCTRSDYGDMKIEWCFHECMYIYIYIYICTYVSLFIPLSELTRRDEKPPRM